MNFMFLYVLLIGLAVRTSAELTPMTILWRPFIPAENCYKSLERTNIRELFGEECIDLCLQMLKSGQFWCRYIVLDPLESEWEKTVVGDVQVSEWLGEMQINKCCIMEHPHPSVGHAKKSILSKGFRNKNTNTVGKFITFEVVTKQLDQWMWPNPFAYVTVPSSYEYMDNRTKQYFERADKCSWSSRQLSPDTTTAAKSTLQSAEPTTYNPDERTTIQYTYACGSSAYHAFEGATCTGTVQAQILYENEFARTKTDGCQMIAVASVSGFYLRETSDISGNVGWCSKTETCGLSTPLYFVLETLPNGSKSLVYSSNATPNGRFLCYVYSSKSTVGSRP